MLIAAAILAAGTVASLRTARSPTGAKGGATQGGRFVTDSSSIQATT
jgi:hypothetical protein